MVMSIVGASNKIVLVSFTNHCLFKSIYKKAGLQYGTLSTTWKFISYYGAKFYIFK